MRTQFNIRIPKATKQRVNKDRLMAGTTSDIVVEVALENLFTRFTPDERHKFYQAHNRKPYARAI